MPRWTAFEPYFHALVQKAGPDDCWRWLGGFYTCGYGRVTRDGKRPGAPRVAYELATGAVLGELLACHSCDNKWCVNPGHIFPGTQKDNMQDWTRKGRNRLANDRSLWSNGKHWANNPGGKERLASQRRSEFASGERVVLRGEGGRLAGSAVSK